MAAGTAKYELTVFEWREVSIGYMNISWGGGTVYSGPTVSSPYTNAYGTFTRGTLQATETGGVNVYHYEVSKDIAVGTGPSTVIYGADFNAVQVKVAGILGTGAYYSGPTNGYGHGQPVRSTTVSPTAVIYADTWNKLVEDCNTLNVHRNGSTSTYLAIVPNLHASTGTAITYDHLQTLDAFATGGVINRYSVANNQITQTNAISAKPINFIWGGSDATPLDGGSSTAAPAAKFEVQFASNNEMHYFFNQGGYVNILGYRDTAATGLTDQEQAWYNLLGGVDVGVTYTQVAAALSAGSGVESVLATYTSSTTPYTGAVITVYIKYYTSNLEIRIVFNDSHLPTGLGPDYIRSGLVGYKVDKTYVTGAYRGGYDGINPTIVETVAWA